MLFELIRQARRYCLLLSLFLLGATIPTELIAVPLTSSFVATNFESFENIPVGGPVQTTGTYKFFSAPYPLSNELTYIGPAFSSGAQLLGDFNFSSSATFSSLNVNNAGDVPFGAAWFGATSSVPLEFEFTSPMRRVGVNATASGSFIIEVLDGGGSIIESQSFNAPPGTLNTSFAGIRANSFERVRFLSAGGQFAIDGLTFDDLSIVRLSQSGAANWNTASHWDIGLVPGAGDEVVIDANAPVEVTGPTSLTQVKSLTIGADPGFTATFTLQPTVLEVVDGLSNGIATLADRSVLSGGGDIGGRVHGHAGSVIRPTAVMNLGAGSELDGFRTEGLIDVGNQSLSLSTSGSASLGYLTKVEGGILEAFDSFGRGAMDLGSGDAISGYGVVNGRFSASAGSVIEVGDQFSGIPRLLTIGANEADGYFSDGTVYVRNGSEIAIRDANEAVLGSLTDLDNGRIVADNATANTTTDNSGLPDDLLLEDGKNIIGRGSIGGNIRNMGSIIGDGTAMNERIEFEDGFTVTGIGYAENVLYSGNHSPGLSPAVVTGKNQAFAGSVELELGGTTPGSGSNGHDQIVDLGEVELVEGVDLSIKPWNGFEPAVGDEFEVLTWGESLAGKFDEVMVDPFFTELGIEFELVYGEDSLMLAAVAIGIAGDFNGNGNVDGSDFLAWQTDPSVGLLSDWQANYGSEQPLTANSSPVPEPSSAVLSVVALLGLCWRCRCSAQVA